MDFPQLRFPVTAFIQHCTIAKVRQKTRSVAYNRDKSRYRFGTDASYLSTIAGIPTVGLGPGNETLAHSPNENVPIDEVITAAKIYVALPARFPT